MRSKERQMSVAERGRFAGGSVALKYLKTGLAWLRLTLLTSPERGRSFSLSRWPNLLLAVFSRRGQGQDQGTSGREGGVR